MSLYIPANPGVYHNKKLWLISISFDWDTWVTIADKNLWATQVYTSWTVTVANWWYVYQWWNMHGFDWTDTSSWTTDTNRVDATWYSQSNPYDSSTWIKQSYWDSSKNTNLWGTQWPCPNGYHIMLASDFNAIKTVLWKIWVSLKAGLYLPAKGYISYNANSWYSSSYVYYWGLNPSGNNADVTYINSSDNVGVSTQYSRWYWIFIRPIKDTPVIPTSQDWEAIKTIRIPDSVVATVNNITDETPVATVNFNVQPSYAKINTDASTTSSSLSKSKVSNIEYTFTPSYINNWNHTISVSEGYTGYSANLTCVENRTVPTLSGIYVDWTASAASYANKVTYSVSLDIYAQSWWENYPVAVDPWTASVSVLNVGSSASGQKWYPWHVSGSGSRAANQYYSLWDVVWTYSWTATITLKDWTTASFPYSGNVVVNEVHQTLTAQQLIALDDSSAILSLLQNESAYYSVYADSGNIDTYAGYYDTIVLNWDIARTASVPTAFLTNNTWYSWYAWAYDYLFTRNNIGNINLNTVASAWSPLYYGFVLDALSYMNAMMSYTYQGEPWYIVLDEYGNILIDSNDNALFFSEMRRSWMAIPYSNFSYKAVIMSQTANAALALLNSDAQTHFQDLDQQGLVYHELLIWDPNYCQYVTNSHGDYICLIEDFVFHYNYNNRVRERWFYPKRITSYSNLNTIWPEIVCSVADAQRYFSDMGNEFNTSSWMQFNNINGAWYVFGDQNSGIVYTAGDWTTLWYNMNDWKVWIIMPVSTWQWDAQGTVSCP